MFICGKALIFFTLIHMNLLEKLDIKIRETALNNNPLALQSFPYRPSRKGNYPGGAAAL